MMTKFGIDQMESAPPKWWRRLERATMIVVLPAATTFVTSVVGNEETKVLVLSALTFITALIKGTGIFLGTDTPYPQEGEKTEEYGQ